MDSQRFKDSLLSATVGFGLWVVAYFILILLMSHRDIWGHLCCMPGEIALLLVLALIFCWFVTCCALLGLRWLVGRLQPPSRLWEEILFVSACGLGGALLLAALQRQGEGLFIPQWYCLCAFPALMMVLAQRGLEWCRAQKKRLP